MRIAIDGPAGAGKSTVARMLAHKLSYRYVDTGAMYRAVTWALLKAGVPVQDDAQIVQFLQNAHIEIRPDPQGQRIWWNGVEVTSSIRSPEVNHWVSEIAKIPAVREKMWLLQSRLAQEDGVIMDGRDIGTRVMPNAELKVFLTASLAERAKRRYAEETAKGEQLSYREIEQNLSLRDQEDANRLLAPLQQAEDAVLVDTSNLSLDQVVASILQLVRREETSP